MAVWLHTEHELTREKESFSSLVCDLFPLWSDWEPALLSVHQTIIKPNQMFSSVHRWRWDPRIRLWSGSWWSFTPASRSWSRNCPRKRSRRKARMRRKRRAATGTLRANEEAAASTAAQGRGALTFPTWRPPYPFTPGFYRGGRSAGEALCLENSVS